MEVNLAPGKAIILFRAACFQNPNPATENALGLN
jgi:hypothetical protein